MATVLPVNHARETSLSLHPSTKGLSLPLEPAPLVRNVKFSKVPACSTLKPHERCAGYPLTILLNDFRNLRKDQGKYKRQSGKYSLHRTVPFGFVSIFADPKSSVIRSPRSNQQFGACCPFDFKAKPDRRKRAFGL